MGTLRTKTRKISRNFKGRKKCHILGIVSEEDKILAYNAATYLCLPSFAELEGMVVLEAMACGKPIIVPNAEMNAAKFFIDENGLFFKTEDHHRFSRENS